MKTLLLVLLVTAVLIGTWLLEALWLMLAIGAMHHDWWHAVPPMGYQAALVVGPFLGAFIGIAAAPSIGSRKK